MFCYNLQASGQLIYEVFPKNRVTDFEKEKLGKIKTFNSPRHWSPKIGQEKYKPRTYLPVCLLFAKRTIVCINNCVKIIFAASAISLGDSLFHTKAFA